MKITFPEGEPSSIVEQFQSRLAGRKLGQMVSFELGSNDDLQVTIKKMGKSSLHFAYSKQNQNMEWELVDEKIAIAHKAFRGEVMGKISKMITDIGGTVVE